MTPEWSRRERLDAIGVDERHVAIEADADERAALAARFGLSAIEHLAARFAIRRDGAGITATGRVEARVVQPCVATAEPVETAFDEPVSLRFVEPQTGGDPDEEIELGGDALDTIEIEGGAIDLGEAAAETMALAIDPFPRSHGAAATLKAAGVVSDEEVRPAGALAGLGALLKSHNTDQ
ncbi:YceD family protein [Sphingomonas rubra]|uniref:Uncharacterized ACR, COG1399 n=1 Tax=Sphingomonas rubra TaxID=634430 RepID=A0A1I5UIS6_9SPHN|nr:DUF177 domain-containing protein [Sphingomonas rubra]SFP95191.1 Uncharacterized ACR, COG1399 [Sphingomonas rubra]